MIEEEELGTGDTDKELGIMARWRTGYGRSNDAAPRCISHTRGILCPLLYSVKGLRGSASQSGYFELDMEAIRKGEITQKFFWQHTNQARNANPEQRGSEKTDRLAKEAKEDMEGDRD